METPVPEWILWVGTGVGTMLGALVIRLGWKSGTSERGQEVDPTMRVLGASLGTGFDGTKISEQLERIGDALEDIRDSVRSLAKSEESGQKRILEELADKMERLDHRFDQRRDDERSRGGR